MNLWLSDTQAQAIARHVQNDAPDEACGLIGGRDGHAEIVVPVENIASDPRHRFEMDHSTLAKTLLEFDKAGLSLVGIYHSHPKSDPIPSPSDVREALYPDAVYVIIGLRGGEPQWSAWRLGGDSVERVDLHVGAQAPDETEPDSLTPAQRIAIIVSALLALILMIALSLSLLPPPPPLPAIIG